MSTPRPFEEVLLAPVKVALTRACRHVGRETEHLRLEVLEAAASQLGGWSLDVYRRATNDDYETTSATALAEAGPILTALGETTVPPALALCSLARPDLARVDRRKIGVYYTDFRLSQYLAGRVAESLTAASTVLDPSSGTGALLAAVVLAVCGADRDKRARMIGGGIAAADLSEAALRGARLALASLTDNLEAVTALDRRLRAQDSLVVGAHGWADVAPDGFDAVVGNPPWEKLKLTRHEFLLAAGVDRHYGDDYAMRAASPADMSQERTRLARYVVTLAERYPLSRSGEPDLYKAFFELSCGLIRQGGQIGLLIPAGLIRSQSTQQLRELLLEQGTATEVTVFENRARFFPIDTRFKFLIVQAIRGGRRQAQITIRHARGCGDQVAVYGTARLGRRQLRAVRPDLTIPEVRSNLEWQIFRRMAQAGTAFGDPEGWWQPRIVRELDMTLDRRLFRRHPALSRLPLVEGRMIHQYRCGAKSYRWGTGRRALWEPNPLGASEVVPQFWIPVDALSLAIRERTDSVRVGFCDVTGQTNERTILAALVPEGVVCGNKVPTITFCGQAGTADSAPHLWLAVANSLPFDWLARRVVTTSVNFFLLLGLPFPNLTTETLQGRRLAALAHELTMADQRETRSPDLWTIGERRAEIDVRVAAAFGLDAAALAVILDDFPLLDRGQPPLPGEDRSTITRDLVLARAAKYFGTDPGSSLERVGAAREAGSVPYVPVEYVSDVRAPVITAEAD